MYSFLLLNNVKQNVSIAKIEMSAYAVTVTPNTSVELPYSYDSNVISGQSFMPLCHNRFDSVTCDSTVFISVSVPVPPTDLSFCWL